MENILIERAGLTFPSEGLYIIEPFVIVSLLIVSGLGFVLNPPYAQRALRVIAALVLYVAFLFSYNAGEHAGAVFLASLSLTAILCSITKLLKMKMPYVLALFNMCLIWVIWYFGLFAAAEILKGYQWYTGVILFRDYLHWKIFGIVCVVLALGVFCFSKKEKKTVFIQLLNGFMILFFAAHLLFAAKNKSGRLVNYRAFDHLTAEIYYGFTVNAVNRKGETRLIQAIREKDINKIRKLIEQGVDVNKPMKKSSHAADVRHPLLIAVSKGDEGIAKLLLENGADVNCFSKPNKLTALHLALGNFDMMKLLVSFGADLTIESDFFGAVLHMASYGSGTKYQKFTRVADIEYLVSIGADLNGQAGAGTPLHYAVLGLNFEGMLKLLELSADPNIRNKEGETPLDLAYAERRRNARILDLNSANRQVSEVGKAILAGAKLRVKKLDVIIEYFEGGHLVEKKDEYLKRFNLLIQEGLQSRQRK